jgi:hypothetical protein
MVLMGYDPVFDSQQNKALLALCARRTIRTAAIFGIVWGCINLVIGYFAVQVNLLNAGVIILGLLMLGAGIAALRKPSLGALLSEAIVSALLLCWNVAITIIAIRVDPSETSGLGHGVILPAIAAVAFFRRYKRLAHLRDMISEMDHSVVKEASGLCKQLFVHKLKQSPDIAETTSPRCRLRFLSDSVFCAQRNFANAFQMSRPAFQQCITNMNKKDFASSCVTRSAN